MIALSLTMAFAFVACGDSDNNSTGSIDPKGSGPTTDKMTEGGDYIKQYIGKWECCGVMSGGEIRGMGGRYTVSIEEDKTATYECTTEASEHIAESGNWEIDKDGNLIVSLSSNDFLLYFNEEGYLLSDYSNEKPISDEWCLAFEKNQ